MAITYANIEGYIILVTVTLLKYTFGTGAGVLELTAAFLVIRSLNDCIECPAICLCP